MAAGDRHSDDVAERMEWQLDQIRQALVFLAVVVAVGIALAVIMAVTADPSTTSYGR